MRIHNIVMAFVLIVLLAPLSVSCTGARCADCGKTIKIDTLEGVHFDFDKYVVKPAGKKILDEDVALLSKDKTLDISIEGHCDIVGSDAYNQNLSERRANAVYKYFLTKGISADRMRTIGYGRTKPLVPNDTAANRAKNRRVEIHIIKARAK
ncbi:MAG: OmpA family protein [Pseudomonadota bacterium]